MNSTDNRLTRMIEIYLSGEWSLEHEQFCRSLKESVAETANAYEAGTLECPETFEKESHDFLAWLTSDRLTKLWECPHVVTLVPAFDFAPTIEIVKKAASRYEQHR